MKAGKESETQIPDTLSSIKEQRRKALKNNYQKPEISRFDFNENEQFEGDDLTLAYMCTSGC
jgi:hypothetical protein